MGIPICQIQMQQNAPPIVKQTDITQKLPNWSKQLENIKSQQNLRRKIKILEQPLQYWEMGLPIYQIEMYEKAPPIAKYTKITRKSPNLT